MTRVNKKMIERNIEILNGYFAEKKIGLNLEALPHYDHPYTLVSFKLSETGGSLYSIVSFKEKRRAWQALERFLQMLAVTELKNVSRIMAVFEYC